MDIGEYIKSKRIEKGLTQLDVAKACGVSKTAVCRWESGKIANMKRDKIAALSKAIGISPAELIYINAPIHYTVEMDFEEYDLLKRFRSADEATQAIIRKILDAPPPK